MKIYDVDGISVDAISNTFDGDNVEGYRYNWAANAMSGAVHFQMGNPKETGLNGLTTEAILAILIHRTQVIDSKVPCRENKTAIEFMKRALETFTSRKLDRIARQVYGEQKQ